MAETLTNELAHKHFRYDRESGRLFWREPTASCVKVGDEAGCVSAQGYRTTRFGGRYWAVHRIVWLMERGDMPAMIDHINGNRLDNRIKNLRPASAAENAQNQRRARADNRASRLIGAAFHKASGKFRARIGVPGGAQIHLGLFDTAEAAHEAYVAAKRQLHAANTI